MAWSEYREVAMYREILNQLAEWKDKAGRKTLLLAGGKGVGKSYTLADFGAGFFTNTCMFDFKEQEYVKYLFEGELDKTVILKKLSVSCGETLVPGETLLVFENVDMLENASSIVKYICEELTEYHVAITLMRLEENFIKENKELEEKLDVINIYPLSFSEFLIVNKESSFCDRIANQAKEPLTKIELEKLDYYMKLYLVVGGIPSVVKAFVESGSLESVETEKAKILMGMVDQIERVEQLALAKKIKQIFESIPAQLEKENMKFQYGMVKLTARAREYKDAVDWLIDNKFITPLYRVKEPVAPLSSQKDEKSFELYVSDIGLLVSMFGLTIDDIDKEKSPFMMRGQALIKQYIYGELLHNPNINNVHYWISDATAKIEFLFQDSDAVIPIDVNLDLNEKAQSLKVYKNKYATPMAVRISKEKMGMTKDMLTLPMFSIWNL